MSPKRSQWQLTGPGQQVFECVEGILGNLEHLGELLQVTPVPLKPLSLRVPEWILGADLIEALDQFRQRSPERKLILRTAESLLENDLQSEVGIQWGSALNAALIQKPLCTLRVGLYVSQTYLAQQGFPLKREDLSKHALIGFESQDPILGASMNWHRNREFLGLRPLAPVFSVQDPSSLIKFAQAHAGIIAMLHAQPELQKSGLVEILSEVSLMHGPQTPVSFVCSPSVWASAEVQLLYVHLKKAMDGTVGRR